MQDARAASVEDSLDYSSEVEQVGLGFVAFIAESLSDFLEVSRENFTRPRTYVSSVVASFHRNNTGLFLKFFRPSAAVCRDGLRESCTCLCHRTGSPPPNLGPATPPRPGIPLGPGPPPPLPTNMT